jgi:hypothetical protein
MKHIIKYRGVLQESESAPDSKLEDVRHLFDIGMINNVELINALIEISDRTGDPLESLLRPGDQYYKIESIGYSEPENAEDLEYLLDHWRGPHGEKVVQAIGTIDEDWFNLDISLSSGTKVHFEYNDRGQYPLTHSYAEVDSTRTHMQAKDFETTIDSYYDEHNNFHQFIHDLLNLLVASSY